MTQPQNTPSSDACVHVLEALQNESRDDAEVLNHLAECDACRDFATDLTLVREVFESTREPLPEEALFGEMTARIMEQVAPPSADEKSPPFWKAWFEYFSSALDTFTLTEKLAYGAAAALLFVGFVGALELIEVTPPPILPSPQETTTPIAHNSDALPDELGDLPGEDDGGVGEWDIDDDVVALDLADLMAFETSLASDFLANDEESGELSLDSLAQLTDEELAALDSALDDEWLF